MRRCEDVEECGTCIGVGSEEERVNERGAESSAGMKMKNR